MAPPGDIAIDVNGSVAAWRRRDTIPAGDVALCWASCFSPDSEYAER
jgi:hypothetical protein